MYAETSSFGAPVDTFSFLFRKEFDAERAKETEEFEKSRPAMGSNRKNNSNAEAE